MTRSEEVDKIASAFAIDEVKDTCNPASKRGLLYVGFITGAEWADAHPDIDVRTMAAWQSGYDEAIEKACEWLDENMNDVGIRFMRGDEIKDIVDLFRKAMKGGERQ